MKAVILAAGKGERLSKKHFREPKPLIPLLGLSLLERAIISAKECGIYDFVIVVCSTVLIFISQWFFSSFQPQNSENQDCGNNCQHISANTNC